MSKKNLRNRAKSQIVEPTITESKELVCDLCHFTTSYKSVLKAHEEIHKERKPFPCKKCKFSAGSKKELVEHHQETHSTMKKYFQRQGTFTTSQRKKIIARGLTNPSDKLFKCSHNQCTFGTRFKSVLDAHEKIHTSPPLFECQSCDFKTSLSEEIVDHGKIHPIDKPFKCTECGFRSDQKRAVKLHQMSVHAEKTFKCPQCSYASTRKSNLENHSKVHSNIKPFKCDLCTYTTAYKCTLQLHQTIHTGEKNLHCSQCDYVTARKSNLDRHEKIHSGIKTIKRRRRPKMNKNDDSLSTMNVGMPTAPVTHCIGGNAINPCASTIYYAPPDPVPCHQMWHHDGAGVSTTWQCL